LVNGTIFRVRRLKKKSGGALPSARGPRSRRDEGKKLTPVKKPLIFWGINSLRRGGQSKSERWESNKGPAPPQLLLVRGRESVKGGKGGLFQRFWATSPVPRLRPFWPFPTRKMEKKRKTGFLPINPGGWGGGSTAPCGA